MIDWTWNWFTQNHPIWQGGFGACEPCSGSYAVAMRAYIQGYPLLEFSQLYTYWYGQGGAANTNHQVGQGMGSALPIFASRGCCLESLHPRPQWEGVDTTTQAFSDACWMAVRTPPSAAAEADAKNYIAVDWQYFASLYNGTLDDMVVKGKAALDAGYIFTAFKPPNHEICIWGYNAYGWLGPDSNSQNADAGLHGWTNIVLDVIVRNVVYKNATPGQKPTPLPKPVVIVPPPDPPPPTTGNTQMLIDTIKAEANALAVGQITQVQIDKLKSDVAALVADATSQPPDTGTLPPGAWKIVASDLSPHLDAQGVSWKARDWNNGRMALTHNGIYEGVAPKEAYYPGTGVVVYVKRPDGTWWQKWMGASWVYMAPGEVPSGYA